LRLLVLAWAVAVVVVDSRSGVLGHPTAAFAVLAVASAWSGMVGVWVLTSTEVVLRWWIRAVDVVVAAMVVGADWFVYDGGHAQSFGSAWPLTAVMLVAVVGGWWPGAAVGTGLGVVNLVAAGATRGLDGRGLSLTGTLVLLAAAGAVAGWVSTRLRQAESEVAAARERERFARTLHDGVLQTLAVVQRRSEDAAIVEMARDQELELRRFIGSGPQSRADLVSELRGLAGRTERHHRVRVEVVVVEAPRVSGERLEALIGAATEAVTNAAKHAGPSTVNLCVDVGATGVGASVTVTDDGSGFDVDRAVAGQGLTRSVRERIEEVGGTVVVRSTVGSGTEVALWVP